MENDLKSQEKNSASRAALYIDGFNLYHAIDDLDEPFLKWSDYWKLGSIIIPRKSQKLVKVVYCTAYYPNDENKKRRHRSFINAQKVNNVTVIEGHYVHEDVECRGCGAKWKKPTEKQGDINVALHLIKDGYDDLYDCAYLLSSDSDQAATARIFRDSFSSKKLVTVAPPERNFSVHIERYASERLKLNKSHIEKCVMPPVVFKPGVTSSRRPKEYTPPDSWIHPDNRPN